MKKKILFRADGNSETGLGHLFRLFALVEMFKDSFEYVYLTRETTVTEAIPSSYKYELIPKAITLENEPLWIFKNFPPSEYFIIADGYHFVSSYQKALKELTYKIAYVDDLAKEHMFADIIVNHSSHFKKVDYHAESYSKFALGTDYAILRPMFLKEAKKSRKITKINSSFVCFGGSDPYDLSLKSVKALLSLPIIEEINVVLGAAYKGKEIFDLKNEKVKIHQDISGEELSNIMCKCQVAVLPISTIFYEAITCKMIIFSGYFVENQMNAYHSFKKKEIFLDLGNLLSCNFESNLKKIEYIKLDEIDNLLKNQSSIIDGMQKVRFLELIDSL
ncbi:UDP-2,4-diacetamido-2,4,6-trideoxy-beta-L-altropyranose hydrolase [Aquimarina sp. LLG6339-5]|uniref:UDP-2,4-diacetamido-2,4, 6-trideoxy-beta-L-altropyranose hydrolase n=1 Tax=Aquimarina sp. LLG6339-5 TaxID=3160830 RepID=UPI0038631EAF